MKLSLATIAMFFLVINVFCQDKYLQLVSPPSEDAVIAYFHLTPESPDGKKMVFTTFIEPDSMEIIVKDLTTQEYFPINKVKGYVRHTGAYPVWINNETLIYCSPFLYKIYKQNIYTGALQEFEGGQISDYSVINNKVLYVNKELDKGKYGVFELDLNTNETKCIITIDDIASLKDELGTKHEVGKWKFDHPCWSPDAKKIMFEVKANGKSIAGSDYLCFSDEFGKNIRTIGLKPMHVQWWDNETLFGYDWHQQFDHHMRKYDLKGKSIEELSGPGNHGTFTPEHEWMVSDNWYKSDPVKVHLYKRGEISPTKILFEQPAVVNGKKFWEIKSHAHPSFSRDGKKVYFNGQSKDGKSKVWCYNLTDIIEKENNQRKSK